MGVLENRFERSYVLSTVDYVFNWARKSAIWPLTFGLACCAIEMIASTTSRFDIARFGAEVFRLAAAGGFDDCGRDGHVENVAGLEARLGADAGSEMVHFDGSLLECGRAFQCLFGAAGSGSNCSGRCVCGRVPASARGAFLRALEIAG